MKFLNGLLIILIIFFIVATSSGEIRTKVVSSSIPLQSADWTLYHTVEKFDPALGDLISVKLDDDLEVVQNVTISALTSSPVVVTVTSKGSINVTLPDSSYFAFSASQTFTESLAGFETKKFNAS